MIRMKFLAAGLVSVAMLATPAIAQEATQEPGVMGYNYPNTRYLTGGYGARFTPRAFDYYVGRAGRTPHLTWAPYGYQGYYAYGPY